jgi:predicted RNA methylase
MNIEELKFLLNKYHLTPNKLRGQNFLIDDSVLEEIIDTADLNPNDLVLEVGPGLGALTAQLLNKAKQVVALELDKNFEQVLAKIAKDLSNLFCSLYILAFSSCNSISIFEEVLFVLLVLTSFFETVFFEADLAERARA